MEVVDVFDNDALRSSSARRPATGEVLLDLKPESTGKFDPGVARPKTTGHRRAIDGVDVTQETRDRRFA